MCDQACDHRNLIERSVALACSRENLGQVCQIVLCRSQLEVLEKVLELGDGSPSV